MCRLQALFFVSIFSYVFVVVVCLAEILYLLVNNSFAAYLFGLFMRNQLVSILLQSSARIQL